MLSKKLFSLLLDESSTESGIKKRLIGALTSVLITLLTGIGSSILAYFLYKNTNAVAVKLMNASARAYNVAVGHLKNAYIWSNSNIVSCWTLKKCLHLVN